jgi:hypothetical protein
MKTYFAKSVFVSKTFWANVALFIIALVKETSFGTQIPPIIANNLLAVAAIINIGLRIFSVRPVAFTMPGDVTPVEVRTLKATKRSE